MPPKFFITHSWQDIDFAKKLCDDLHAHGLDGFFDAYSIQPGDDIAGRIAHGLETCDVYVPLLSPAAVASKWCTLEINAAINLSLEPEQNGCPRIIPIVVIPCKLPTLLRGRLYINFHQRYDDALKELLAKGFGVAVKLPVAQQPTHIVPMPTSTKITDPPEPPSVARVLPTLKRLWIPLVGGIIGLVLALGLLGWFAGQPNTNPTSTQIAQATITIALPTNTTIPTVFPTFTFVPPAKPTATPTNTPTFVRPTSVPIAMLTNTPTFTPIPAIVCRDKDNKESDLCVTDIKILQDGKEVERKDGKIQIKNGIPFVVSFTVYSKTSYQTEVAPVIYPNDFSKQLQVDVEHKLMNFTAGLAQGTLGITKGIDGLGAYAVKLVYGNGGNDFRDPKGDSAYIKIEIFP